MWLWTIADTVLICDVNFVKRSHQYCNTNYCLQYEWLEKRQYHMNIWLKTIQHHRLAQSFRVSLPNLWLCTQWLLMTNTKYSDANQDCYKDGERPRKNFSFILDSNYRTAILFSLPFSQCVQSEAWSDFSLVPILCDENEYLQLFVRYKEHYNGLLGTINYPENWVLIRKSMMIEFFITLKASIQNKIVEHSCSPKLNILTQTNYHLPPLPPL